MMELVINVEIRVDSTPDSENGLETYEKCGKRMGCIIFHLLMRMTSQQYSRFEVSKPSYNLTSGIEAVCTESRIPVNLATNCLRQSVIMLLVQCIPAQSKYMAIRSSSDTPRGPQPSVQFFV
jgi:hypothetical protein